MVESPRTAVIESDLLDQLTEVMSFGVRSSKKRIKLSLISVVKYSTPDLLYWVPKNEM